MEKNANEWQPIETAPKDGTAVLVGHSNSVWIDHWIAYSSKTDAGYWADFDDNGNPTHWMPLPDPPKQ